MDEEAIPRIVLVEDDRELAGLTAEYLQAHGLRVDVMNRASGVVERVLTDRPDMAVLDIMLPDGNGLDLCRELRRSWRGPILMLTALGDETDTVVGLELGADDYVAKPASPRVLLARIRALLRRNAGDPGAEALICGPLRIDLGARTAFCAGSELSLTTCEFELLELLARRTGRVQERSALVEELRGIDFRHMDRTVDVTVSRLRRKLEAAGGEGLIRTVRGVGYVLSAKAAGR